MPNYDDGRLVRLLRLLPAPPPEWVRRAQRIPLGTATLTDRDLEELGRKLERDPSFRRQFDADPVAAAAAAGLHELGLRLQPEPRELPALAQRLASDYTPRAALVRAPRAPSLPISSAAPV